jgi:hypothetical protein
MSDYYSDRDDQDPDQQEAFYDDEESVPFWRRPLVLGAASVLVVFIVVVVVAYNWGVERGERRVPPLVQADSAPVKVRPEDPGGMTVPHKDRLIYDRMTGRDTKEPVEQLLPGPEEPVRTPTAPGGTAAGHAAATAPAANNAPAADNQTASSAPAEQTPPPAGQGTGTSPATGTPVVESRPLDQPGQAATPPADATKAPPPRVAALEEPKPSSASGPVYIQLGAVREAGAATGEWARLTRRMPDLLASRTLQARRVDLGAKGVYYRLQTGPFASRGDAQHLCDQIKARGAGCMVITR